MQRVSWGNDLKFYFDYNGTEIYGTPNLDSLPFRTKSFIETGLLQVAAQGFHREITQAFKSEVLAVARSGILFLIVQNNDIVGFASLKYFLPLLAVYVHGVVKCPSAPSKVLEEVIRRYVEDQQCQVLVATTQNDRVVEIFTSLCQEVVAGDRDPRN